MQESDGRLRATLACGTMFWGDTCLDSLMGRGVPAEDDLETIVSVLSKAGVDLYDTAEGYGFGSSETRLARAVRNAPGSPRLMTKFMPTVWRWSKAAFMSSLRHSIARLGKPAVYFIHTPVHPMFLSWVDYAFEAKRAGLIGGVGLSNCSEQNVRDALQVARRHQDKIDANQVLFSLLDYKSVALQRMLALCRDNDVTVVAYSTLGQGLLADGLTRQSYGAIRATKMLRGLTYDRLTRLRATVAAVAAECGQSMAAVCINWTLCKGCVPLVGMRTPRHAREAVKAVSGWRLTADQIDRLEAEALDISTLDKPTWKRALFVLLISLLLLAYRLTRCISYRRKPH